MKRVSQSPITGSQTACRGRIDFDWKKIEIKSANGRFYVDPPEDN